MNWPWNGGQGKGEGKNADVAMRSEEDARLRSSFESSREQMETMRKHIENLHTFAKKLGKIEDLREVYRFVADVAIKVFEFDRINILIADEKAGMLECVETRGNKDEPIEAIRLPISPESGALYHSYKNGSIILLDVGTREEPVPLPDEYLIRKPWSEIKAFRSTSCIVGALLGREKSIGIFGIDRKFRKMRVTKDDVALVKLLRDIASYSIQNLQAMETLKAHQMEINGHINGAMSIATEAREKAARMAAVNRNLLDSSKKIAGITKAIGSIATQTNLLSVNAAIEAARAGTQGLSFGVVAGEVKRLAGQTSEASGEIEGIIRRISGEISLSQSTMEEVVSAQQGLIRSIEVLHAKAETLA